MRDPEPGRGADSAAPVGGARACATPNPDGALVCWGDREALNSAHELDSTTPAQIACVADTDQTAPGSPEPSQHCSATIAPPVGQG